MADDNRKIIESIQNLHQRIETGFNEIREEMQGGFALTHERIDKAENNIKHVLETVIDLHDSLDKRVERLEEEITTHHSH